VSIDEVAAIVITHGPNPDLEDCLEALRPQVDDLLVVQNVPGPAPAGVRSVTNVRPVGYAANINRGLAATTAPIVVVANPDAIADPNCVERLAEFLRMTPRAGVVGPALRYPDGTWQPSRRRFPTVVGTLLRRTPLRLVLGAERYQRDHYQLDAPAGIPLPADWLLGGFVVLRRSAVEAIGGMDEKFRLYGEDIDLGYRMWQADWECWYVPLAGAVHRYAAVIDKKFLTVRNVWHLRGMMRFVRKHPEAIVGRNPEIAVRRAG
jgi:GT2 family glycosyltransferase